MNAKPLRPALFILLAATVGVVAPELLDRLAPVKAAQMTTALSACDSQAMDQTIDRVCLTASASVSGPPVAGLYQIVLTRDNTMSDNGNPFLIEGRPFSSLAEEIDPCIGLRDHVLPYINSPCTQNAFKDRENLATALRLITALEIRFLQQEASELTGLDCISDTGHLATLAISRSDLSLVDQQGQQSAATRRGLQGVALQFAHAAHYSLSNRVMTSEQMLVVLASIRPDRAMRFADEAREMLEALDTPLPEVISVSASDALQRAINASYPSFSYCTFGSYANIYERLELEFVTDRVDVFLCE